MFSYIKSRSICLRRLRTPLKAARDGPPSRPVPRFDGANPGRSWPALGLKSWSTDCQEPAGGVSGTRRRDAGALSVRLRRNYPSLLHLLGCRELD